MKMINVVDAYALIILDPSSITVNITCQVMIILIYLLLGHITKFKVCCP